MQRHRIMNNINHLYLTLVFLFLSTLPGYAAELTQRDWMVTLVDTVGWSYGLPDEPQDPDYINILTGNRELRFEAEDVYSKDEDNVSIMSFRNFGAFGGSGWLHGTRKPTAVHLRVSLPISGEYKVHAQIRQAGHQFSVDGTVIEVDAKAEFTLVSIGTFQMQSGAQEIIVTLPPGGSIDYITLKAPNLAAITPADGWQPDETLTWGVIQTTLLQLLDLAELFPSNPTPLVFEAEELAQDEIKVVNIPHLGHPSGGKWLRTGPLPAKAKFPIKLAESGFYDLSLRVMGNPVAISVGGHQDINLEAKAYLDDYTFKSLFLFAGDSNITLTLPPGGGVDKLVLTGRQIDTALLETLFGFAQQNQPGARDIDTLTSLLAAFGVKR
ncbi:MAG: hypothetical protein KAU27_02195 [Desulfuromonadales bacterium]|nr:hypothetical protein [Desulfuromonadales bacterium]